MREKNKLLSKSISWSIEPKYAIKKNSYGYLNLRGPHWKVPLILFKRFLEYSSKMILNFIVIQKGYSKYNHESTDVDFDSDLVVEGAVLELQSLSSLLKIFNNVFND